MKKKILCIYRKPDAEEEQRKALCVELLAADRQRLLIKWPFTGGVIMRMELTPVWDDRLRTAATDGDTIFVNVPFYARLSVYERLFVLAHEVWHCILLHFARRGKRDRERFNIAADLEIHFVLRDEGLQEPWVLPFDPSWQGLSAEEIYEQLTEAPWEKLEMLSRQKGSGAGVSNESIGSNRRSFDRHFQNGSSEDGNTSEAPDEIEIHEVDADEQYPEGIRPEEFDECREEVRDPQYTFKPDRAVAERIRSRIISAAQQIMRRHGRLPSHIERVVNVLQNPQIPWQELLKQFVTSCFGSSRRWLPPSRRHLWQDLYLPSMREERLKAVVALDTSGSTALELPQFFCELTALLKSFGRYEICVIHCDCSVCFTEHFSDTSPIEENHVWKAHGGGGTDFRPAFQYVEEKLPDKPDLMLYITDGCGCVPDNPPPFPVLWLLTGDGQKPARWGHTVSLKP